MSECGFCKGKPVADAATWIDGKPRPPAPCPRCGEVSADPKPEKAPRVSAQKYASMRLRAFERDQHVCVICLRARPLSAHHIVKRQDGGDVLANLASLCGDGTSGCHGDVEHYRNGARQKLRLWIESMPEVLCYVLERKGAGWLDSAYPREALVA